MNKQDARTASMTDLLDQRKWWRAKTTGPVKRKDMDIRHKANTLAWLLTHAQDIAHRESYDAYATSAPGGWPEVDAMQADPIAWMLRQPLVQALSRDLTGAAGVLIDLAPYADPAVARREIAAFDNGVRAGHAAALTAVRLAGAKRTTSAARLVVERCCLEAEEAEEVDNG